MSRCFVACGDIYSAHMEKCRGFITIAPRSAKHIVEGLREPSGLRGWSWIFLTDYLLSSSSMVIAVWEKYGWKPGNSDIIPPSSFKNS